MRLLLAGILLHQSHEKDEQNRSRRDSNNNGNDHDGSAYYRGDSDISVAYCNLGNYLVVNASYKIVQFRVDLAI